tara:strand:+ start:53 stop:1045 length:993 start_codon:yes stop_codon:yes gene_type:complete
MSVGGALTVGGAISAASLTLTTDLAVAQGGTGASSLTDGGVLLGSGTGAITPMAVLTDGQMIVGDGTGDPVAESGATLRSSIGVDAAGTDNSTNVTLAGSLDYLTISGQAITRGAIVLTTDVTGTLPIAKGGTNATSAGAALTALGAAARGANSDITSLTGLTTDLTVAQGGTGAGTFATKGVLYGNGTSAIGATAVGSNGQVLTSNGSGSAPTFQTISAGFPAPDFTSSEQTVSTGTLLNVSHGLGSIPTLVTITLRCKTGNLGYSAGDELLASSLIGSRGDAGAISHADSSYVSIVSGTAGIEILNTTAKQSGVISVGSWRWIVRAWA